MSFALAVMFCLTATSANAACAESDLACFRRGFLERGLQLESFGRELELLKRQISSQNEEISVIKVADAALREALEATKPALKAAVRQWHEDPKLWFSLGIVAGVLFTVGVTVLGVWSLGQLARAQ